MNTACGTTGTGPETRKFYALLACATGVSLLLMVTHPPRETGWWIFRTVTVPYQFLLAAAFLIASGYVFLITRWYAALGDRFRCGESVRAFLQCGTLSIMISSVFWWVWHAGATRTEEVGWWIFKHDESVYRNGLFALLDSTAAIAGPLEETGKLLALLCAKPVRDAIVDRKSGLYYATLCAFGFAMIENVTYFEAAEGVLYLRANPAHAVFSSVWGAALGDALGRGTSLAPVGKALLIGMGLHALWNVCASRGGTPFILAFGFTTWLGMRYIERELSRA